jgi:S-adenosylmethionine:tRNA ribosyltransferase-isomerase
MLHPKGISILDYTYLLPNEKIASFPSQNREESKLLISNGGQISESRFVKIKDFLLENSTLIFNDTKVISARLNFLNTSGQDIEIFCLSPAESHQDPELAMISKGIVKWKCLVGHAKKWKEEKLTLFLNSVELNAKICNRNHDEFEIEFSWSPSELHFYEVIEQMGQLPIPPYLKRESTKLDEERYQTVYSSHKGSVAAPTAGLHFTKEILDDLKQSGIESIYITLHVGAGTFKPVKSESMDDHAMHSEWMNIELKTIENIQSQLQGNIICVGTTSLRAIESLYWMGLKAFHQPELNLEELEISQWDAYDLNLAEISNEESLTALIAWMKNRDLDKLSCLTQILIAPPYQLKIAKGLVTNFHQPQSTLLLLVAAVVGFDWQKIYDYALTHDFRFLSYGDSSLLLK